jgi:hypothetical protein
MQMEVAPGKFQRPFWQSWRETQNRTSLDIRPVGGWRNQQQVNHYLQVAAGAGATRLGQPRGFGS